LILIGHLLRGDQTPRLVKILRGQAPRRTSQGLRGWPPKGSIAGYPLFGGVFLSNKGRKSPRRRGGTTRERPRAWASWARGGGSVLPRKSKARAAKARRGKSLGREDKGERERISLS
jgi:hypothetical protein